MIFSRRQNKSRITIGDALHGTRVGRLQSVGYMQVIPLLSDLEDERFVSPVEASSEVATQDYGTLLFTNPSDAFLIVPCHAAYVVKHAAQDHAMSHTGIVKSQDLRAFNTAMCVQQTQGGLIREGCHQLSILPFALRERALELRQEMSYDKLWSAIAAFQNELGIPGASHLEFFLKRFRRELDEFVAEFECAPDQIGAIILVDDCVVGIERAPSRAYWKSVWPALIRECYGSLAIQVARKKGEQAAPPASRVPLPADIGTLEELGRAVEAIEAEEDQRTRDRVRELLYEELKISVDDMVDGVTVETIDHRRFVGQVVRDGDRVVYASILSSKHGLQDEMWKSARPFTI